MGLDWLWSNQQAEKEKEETKVQAVENLSYHCLCKVANYSSWTTVDLCKMHRIIFKDKTFAWLVNQLSSGIWPPIDRKQEGDAEGKSI